VPQLDSGQTLTFPFKVSPTASGPLQVRIICSASRVDLSTVQFLVPLALEVRTLRETAKTPKLDKSPYIVGSPIDPKSNMFYGREDIIDQIKRALRTEGSSTVILLEGNRRVGKSSLLRQFATKGVSPDWVSVYASFQGFDGKEGRPGMATSEIFYGIAKELAASAAKAVPSFRLPDVEGQIPAVEGMEQTRFFIKKLRPVFAGDNPFECFQLIAEAVLEAIAPRRLLLMFDEFDMVQQGIDNGVTSPQLPENLRNLFQTYDNISGILTGSWAMRRLRQEQWSALFGIGIHLPIKGLDPKAARRLVTEPVQGQLVYAPAAVDYVVGQCALQPFLIQGLCHCIFELCAASREQAVTVELATRAAARYAQDNEHFRELWDKAGNNRRRYLLCLVDQLRDKPAPLPVTLELLRNALEKKGIAYRAVKRLIEDLAELVALEILGTEGDQRQRAYRIEIPIFSQWLRRNVDSEAHRLEAINELE
jgi:type I restriction enzyme M protein